MKRIRKHKMMGFMLVAMMTILVLLPHMSSAMGQDSFGIIEELEEVQYINIENQGSSGELQKENQLLKIDGEMALYAGIAVTCPVLLMLAITLYRRRDVDTINYW